MEEPHRRGWRMGLAALGLGLLAVPVLGVSLSGSASTDSLWTTLRMVALMGFTLVFADTLTGALRPPLIKVLGPRPTHRLHVTVGVTGLSLVVLHPILVLVYGLSAYESPMLWLGLATLIILVMTVLTALARRRLRRSWRWIHRLNYLVFAAAVIHGIALGYDLGAETWLRVLFLTYAGVVALALLYKYVRRTSRRPAK